MEFFTGLDVGVDQTAVCVVDDKGKVALETTVVTGGDQRGIEAVSRTVAAGRPRGGALSPWLHPELLKAGSAGGVPGNQHVRAAMAAQRNKTDAADALGIAHIMRTGWFRSQRSRPIPAMHDRRPERSRNPTVLTRSSNGPQRFVKTLDTGQAFVEGEIPFSGRGTNGGFWSRKVENA
jgi:hypothetical protein